MTDRDGFLVRVIDDDAAVRDSLEALLVVAGYPVASFASAEEYLSCADGRGEGCILLDLHMPGIGGLGLMEALAVREGSPPVVVLTASREPPVHDRARRLGARAILTKPVLQATLLSTLAAIGGAIRV